MFTAKNIERIKKYQSHFYGTNSVNFANKESTLVMMNEYAITNASDSAPILGSYGASSCLILAVRDTQTTTTFLAHITTMTLLSSVEEILIQFSPTDSIAHLIGGHWVANTGSFIMCLSVIDMIEKIGIPIANADVVRSQRPGGSMAIDARTGEVFAPVTKSDFTIPCDFNQRLMQSISMEREPLRKITAHSPLPIAPVDNSATNTRLAETPPLRYPDTLINEKLSCATSDQTRSHEPVETRRELNSQQAQVSNGGIFKPKKKTEDVSFCGLKKGFFYTCR